MVTAGALAATLMFTPAVASDEDTLAGAAERVRAAKMKDAALRSIDASVASLADELATPEAQAVTMLDDPGRHRVRAESRNILRSREKQRLTDAFREQLSAFAMDRGDDLPPGWVDDVMTQEQSRVDQTVNRLLDQKFEALYEKARRRAVRAQRGHLEEIVYPESAEVEALAGAPDRFVRARPRDIPGYVTTPNGQALIDDHIAAITAEGPLFEENEAILEGQQRAAVRDALVLLWRQLRLVQRADPEDALKRSVIEAKIESDLQRLANEAEEVSGTSYGVFPSARSFAAERAEQLEVRGFEEFVEKQLDSSAGCSALPAERVLRDVPSSFDQVPKELAGHERLLRQSLFAPTEQYVIEQYARSLEDVAARATFRTRLQDLLREQGKAARLLEEGFTECLRKPLKKHREELAAQELAARLPTVEDFSLELGDSALQKIEASPLGALDASELPGPEGLRLEESRARYDSHRQQLLDEARDVLWRQTALTRSPERKGSFVRQIEADSDRSEERKIFWQGAYEKDLLEAWRAVRTEELLKGSDGQPYRPDKYDRVLGPVAEIIDEIITLEFGKAGGSGTAQAMAGTSEASGAGTSAEGTGGTGEAPGQQAGSQDESQLASRPGDLGQEGTGGSGPGSGGGHPSRSEGKTPQEGSGGGGSGGGGGKGVDCTPMLERCAEANQVCYDALVLCKRDPEKCNPGITRCHMAKTMCEELWQQSAALEARAPRREDLQDHRHRYRVRQDGQSDHGNPGQDPDQYRYRDDRRNQYHGDHIRTVSDQLRSVRRDLFSLIRHAGDAGLPLPDTTQ